ncbi:MAG: 1-acyl-sn-glycerol-3-phosphate acyltransferase [Hyphomicrobiales bacterium]
MFWSVIGASWFWFLGATVMAQLPVFTRDVLLANDAVANAFVGLFTIGIGAGSLLTNALLKGEVSPRYVPIASIMMTVFLLDLYFAAGDAHAVMAGQTDAGVAAFFSHWQELARRARPVLRRLLRRALRGAAQRHHAAPFRAVAAVARHRRQQRDERDLHDLLGHRGCGAAEGHVGAGLLPAARAVQRRGLGVRGAPADAGADGVDRALPVRLFYRVEVKGLENYRAAGRKAVIVANHTSFLDGPLLSAFLPERASFAIDTHVSQRWWAKPAFIMFKMIPSTPPTRMALRVLVDELKKGRKVVIFPEGRLTVTGALMKVYEGPGAIAQMAGARVLPVRIDGALYTPSRA